MNEKEIREIRRRFRPDKSMIGSVYGCYVNEDRKIVATFEEFLSGMPQEESERFLSLLKKSLSGTLGKNLVNIEFSAKQVMFSDEHKLLSMLRQDGLKNSDMLRTFYQRVTETLSMGGNYLILLTHDVYTVPFRATDGEIQKDASDEEFSYILCSICPVKLTPKELSYRLTENRFHTSQGSIVSAPELGFLFPAFDDRAANIYGALYYMKNAAENHQEFIDAVFHVEPPMPAAAQKEVFQAILAETLKEDCSLEVVQAVHEHLSEMIDRHKENKEPEQLLLSQREMGAVLQECGVSIEHVQDFAAAFDAHFGTDAQLPPANVIDKKQFVIRTPDVVIKVTPERSDLIETRVIDGSRFILIPAEFGVEVNGVSVKVG
jgi:hypothetical protein